jgi:hypothetical protein
MSVIHNTQNEYEKHMIEFEQGDPVLILQWQKKIKRSYQRTVLKCLYANLTSLVF